MTSKKSITIVIAYYNSCKYREANFNFVRSHILKSEIPLVVSEQLPLGEAAKDILGDKYKHIYHNSSLPFHKTKLLNLAFDHVETDYVLFLDCDVYFEYSKLIDYISDQKVLRPFSSVFCLEKNASSRFISNETISTENSTVDRFFGKHAIALKSSIFLESGGYDENFFGWGWEDFDFIFNKLKYYQFDIVEDLNAVHLWHPSAKKVNERNNYHRFLENKGSRKPLSICTVIDEDFENQKINIENFLNNHIQYNELIDFTMVSFGPYDPYLFDSIKDIWVKFPCVKHFSYSDANVPFFEKINTSIYLSEGESFFYFDFSYDIKHLNLTTFLSLSSRSAGFLEHENFIAYKRDFFNQHNGYKESLSINDCNKLFKTKSVSPQPFNVCTFGVRDGINYSNFKNNYSEPI
jgi:hypothetical protein